MIAARANDGLGCLSGRFLQIADYKVDK